MLFESLKPYRTTKLIRNAIDNYPDGICFAAVDGRPILVNRKMNELYHSLKGHTVTNMFVMWKELEDLSMETGVDGELLIRTPDSGIWQFTRQQLSINGTTVIQCDASDITELFAYRERLKENVIKVAAFHERQRDLLQNILQNNLDRELLNAKLRIHDAFGRLLVMTKRSLSGEENTDKALDLISAWENMITDMRNAALLPGTQQASPEKELVQIADLIGCSVEFEGNQPTQRKALLLLYAAIREALTNAVRHANASRLIISIKEEAGKYRVLITSNGRTDVSSIREGGGLGALRKRLEQDGAAMEIVCDHGVALRLTIPKE